MVASSTPAGSGKWIYRDADQDKCLKPTTSTGVRTGDIWQCNCGKKYQVTVHSDQREGNWMTWKEVVSTGDQRDARTNWNATDR